MEQKTYDDQAFSLFNAYYKQNKLFDKNLPDYYAFLFYLINALEDIVVSNASQKVAAEIVRGMLVHLYHEVKPKDAYDFFLQGGFNAINNTTLYKKATEISARSHAETHRWRCSQLIDTNPAASDLQIKKMYREIYINEMLIFAKNFQLLVIQKNKQIDDNSYAALLCYLGLLSEASLQLRGDKEYDYAGLKTYFDRWGKKADVSSLGIARNAIFHNERALLPRRKTLVGKEVYTMAIMQKYAEQYLHINPTPSWIEHVKERVSQVEEAKEFEKSQTLLKEAPKLQSSLSIQPLQAGEQTDPQDELDKQALEEMLKALGGGKQEKKEKSTQKGLWMPSKEDKKNVEKSGKNEKSEKQKQHGSSQHYRRPLPFLDQPSPRTIPRSNQPEEHKRKREEKEEDKRSQSP